MEARAVAKSEGEAGHALSVHVLFCAAQAVVQSIPPATGPIHRRPLPGGALGAGGGMGRGAGEGDGEGDGDEIGDGDGDGDGVLGGRGGEEAMAG